MREDRFDFRSEDEPSIVLMIIEWLDPHAIACEHEPTALPIPEGNSKVAFDLVNEIKPAFFIEMKQRFTVSARRIAMAALFQPAPQIFVVVDLAIENQPDVAARATLHRLIAGWWQVDDRKAAETEPQPVAVENPHTDVVRTAVRHRIAHPLDKRALDVSYSRSVFPNSANAAH